MTSRHNEGPDVPAPSLPSRKAPTGTSPDLTLQEGGTMIDIMGPQEVAELLGVKAVTVRTWRSKGMMPDPDMIVSRVPIWTSGTIIRWAVQTGKLTAETIK